MSNPGDISRRDVLRGFGSAAAMAGMPGVPGLSLGAIQEFAGLGLPSQFVLYSSISALHVACTFEPKRVMDRPGLKDFVPDYFFKQSFFQSMCCDVGHLLKIPVATRRTLLKTSRFKNLLESEISHYRFSDPATFADDARLIAAVFDAWRSLKEQAPTTGLDALTPKERDILLHDGCPWPQRATKEGHPCHPPAWWHGLSPEDKLKVFIEGQFTASYKTPLGLFVTDDERLLDIACANLELVDNGPKRWKFTMAKFLNDYGPAQARKEFLRSWEWVFRAEGFSIKEARAKAAEAYEKQKIPPVMLVERAKENAPAMAAYTVRLTAFAGASTDIYRLLTTYHTLAAALDETGEPFALRWRPDNSLHIRLGKNGAGRGVMDDFCFACFEWGPAWFTRQPHGLEPEPARQHRELVSTPGRPGVVTHIIGPNSQAYGMVPKEWSELRFHL